MDDRLTTAANHLVCEGGENRSPYFCYDILHDRIRSKRVFECRSPMYNSWLEGLPPLPSVGQTCSTRKGKRGECVFLLFHAMATGTYRWINRSWFKNFYSSHLLQKPMGQTKKRWIELLTFPRTLATGFFTLRAALSDSTCSSSSNSPPAYSSGLSWSSTASRDKVFRAI